MAQNAKIVLDVEFGQIDEAKVKELGKRFSDSLRKEVSSDWLNLEKSIEKIRKDYDKANEDSNKISQKKSVIEEKVLQNIAKYKKIQDNINKTQFKYNKKDDTFSKQKNTLNKKLFKIQKDIAKFAEDDSEESNEKMKQSAIDKEQVQKELAMLEVSQQQSALEFEKDSKDLLENELDLKDTINQLDKEKNQLLNDDYEINELKNKLIDEESTATEKLKKMQEDRVNLAATLAKEMQNAGMSEKESLQRAKKLISFDAKQTDFEKKHHSLLQKTKSVKKEEIKQQLLNLDLQKTALKQAGIGWLERGRIIRAEKKAILGHASFAQQATMGTAELGSKAVQGVTDTGKEQGAQLLGVIKHLSGPLLALGGIAGFVMTMLNYNKEVQKARKNLLTLGLTAGDMWKNVENNQIAGSKSMDGYISTLQSMWGKVGMEYKEALENAGALVNTGLSLEKVMSHNGELLVEVEHMATLSGKSFGDMSSITSEWINDFRKDTKDLMGTFVSLRHDASNAGVSTNRFFSSVMNASQGMQLYGTNVEDVSAAMSFLVKGSKLGQKEASNLATGLVTLNKSMNNQQKYLVVQQSGVIKNFELEKEELIKSNAEIEERLSKNKKLSKEETKRFEEQKARLSELNATVFNTNSTEFERFVRAFENLDPAEQIKSVLKSIFKSKGIKVDIEDPTELKKVLADANMLTELTELGKPFGMNPDQWRLIDDITNKGISLKGLGKELSESEKKRIEKSAKQQADTISQGTKPILDSIEQTITGWLRSIYLGVEKIVGFLSDFFSKDAKETLKLNEEIVTELKNAQDKNAKIMTDIAETDIKLKHTSGNDKDKLESQRKVLLQQAEENRKYIEILKQSKGNVAAIQHSQENATVLGVPIPFSGVVKGNLTNVGERIEKQKQELKEAKINKVLYDQKAAMATGKKSTQQIGEQIFKFGQGGYTGNGPIDKVAGVVHKKEFVFDSASTKKAGPDNLSNLMNSIKTSSFEPSKKSLNINDMVSKAVGSSQIQQPQSNISNQVTININQKDRQEIEQIVQKVLYNGKRSGY